MTDSSKQQVEQQGTSHLYACPGCGDPTTGAVSESGLDFGCCPCCCERTDDMNGDDVTGDKYLDDRGPYHERAKFPSCPKCGSEDVGAFDGSLECGCGHRWVPPGVYVETPAPPSNLTTPEPSDTHAIDRIAAYLRRNGYVEVTIWDSRGAVYRRDHLHDALAQAERERDDARETIRSIHSELSMVRNDATDGRNWKILLGNIKSDLAAATEAKERAERERNEADRRAGAAERRNAEYVESEDRHRHWLRERKRERGVSESQSFDVLWDDTCKLADAYHAIRQSLGINPNTHPQEVVKAVGRMREALVSLDGLVERATIHVLGPPAVTFKKGRVEPNNTIRADVTNALMEATELLTAEPLKSILDRLTPTEQAALAAQQRKEGE